MAQDIGNFFRIDRRIWAEICCQLGFGPAVVYLVLACGTGRDNVGTSWSLAAVNKYGGIAVERAKKHLTDLIDRHFLRQIREGTRPRYELLLWAEVSAARAESLRREHPLSNAERRLWDSVRSGTQPRTYLQQELARQLQRHGWLFDDRGVYLADPPQPVREDVLMNAIWLPNSLITDTGGLVASPVAHVRAYQDVLLLRLLVDLYYDQDLRDDGGIQRDVLRMEFTRERLAEQNGYTVWCFKQGDTIVTWGESTRCHKVAGEAPASEFFKRIRVLEREGLLKFVPHLCESADPQAEVIHAYGTAWHGGDLDDQENRAGHAAQAAALALLVALSVASGLLAPVPSRYPNVQMVGIARLQHHPQTKRTTEWEQMMRTRLQDYIVEYRTLQRTTGNSNARPITRTAAN